MEPVRDSTRSIRYMTRLKAELFSEVAKLTMRLRLPTIDTKARTKARQFPAGRRVPARSRTGDDDSSRLHCREHHNRRVPLCHEPFRHRGHGGHLGRAVW